MSEKPRVLVADDDRTTLKILETMLRKHGYDPILCSSGEEALHFLSTPDCPKLLLLDWNMPDVSGLKIVQELRQRENECYHIIMITGRSEEEDVKFAFEKGVDDFIHKPFDESSLVRRLLAAEATIARELELQVYRRYWQMHAGKMETLAESREKLLLHADRMATIGTMSAGVAHEINNPTSFISGNAQTLEKFWEFLTPFIESCIDSNPPEKKKLEFILEETPSLIEGMRRGVERISNIVDGLKKHAHVSEKSKLEEVSITDLIESSVKMTRSVTKGNVNIDTSKCAAGQIIHADKVQLEQVLINLIVNAAHAMEGLETKNIDICTNPDGETVILEISDTGPGIPESALEKIWTPFFTTKEVGKGTGLGLHICKSIIEGHGGEISVSNRKEGGATFAISLPLKN